MSRSGITSLLTALEGTDVQPFYAVEFELDTAPIRLWTGYGDKVINSDTYTGSGNLLTIDGFEEVADLSAKSITISVSGIPSDLLEDALTEPYQRRPCRVYFGTRDQSTIVEIFSGFLNTMTIEDSGETSTISVLVDSKLVRLERPSNRRYTEESHRARYPSDNFFSYVQSLQQKDIVWGRAKA